MNNRLRLDRAGAVAALMALFATGSAVAQPGALEDSRARWLAAGVSDYEYAYNKFCECHAEVPPETVVTVSDGTIVRVYHKHADSDREVPARDGSLEYYWTVDDLFALIESALARNATVRARYDEALGFPVQIYVDYQPELVGDELDVRLTRLDVAGL